MRLISPIHADFAQAVQLGFPKAPRKLFRSQLCEDTMKIVGRNNKNGA
jgi:hypothetical protein